MFPPFLSRPLARLIGCAAALLLVTRATAQVDTPASPNSAWDITDLLDKLPDLPRFGMPIQNPESPLRFYARPHLGDFLRRDYLRLPIGARVRVTTRTELNAEFESYFTHGLADTAGYGFSGLRLGAKHDQPLDATHGLGWSYGLDFTTPLSRPPIELTDGHRHTSPYTAFTRTIVPSWRLVGYTGLSVDLLDHSAIAPNFRRNQLHTNSAKAVVGVTRDWPLFRAAVTATYATSALMSDETHQVFTLRPDVIIPLTRKTGVHTKIFATIGGRAVWGPDGHELGVSSSLRIEFRAKPAVTKP